MVNSAIQLPCFDQLAAHLGQRFARFVATLPGEQRVVKILPQHSVPLEINQHSRLVAGFVGQELDAAHGVWWFGVSLVKGRKKRVVCLAISLVGNGVIMGNLRAEFIRHDPPDGLPHNRPSIRFGRLVSMASKVIGGREISAVPTDL